MARSSPMRVEVNPTMLRWARERSGIDEEQLAHRFPKLGAWENRDVLPTLNQLEQFARATHAPIGYLFLDTPPVERIPIPDFRTAENKRIDYGLDFCPAFWEWLVRNNEAAKVFSIEKIGDEIAAGADELSNWAAARGNVIRVIRDRITLPDRSPGERAGW